MRAAPPSARPTRATLLGPVARAALETARTRYAASAGICQRRRPRAGPAWIERVSTPERARQRLHHSIAYQQAHLARTNVIQAALENDHEWIRAHW